MPDVKTREKWDKVAPNFDLMAGGGAEVRWKPYKQKLFGNMEGKILFLALGTGLDIPTFPPGKDITAIDISPKMLEQARDRIAAYDGTIRAEVMDVHEMPFEPDSFGNASIPRCSNARRSSSATCAHSTFVAGGPGSRSKAIIVG